MSDAGDTLGSGDLRLLAMIGDAFEHGLDPIPDHLAVAARDAFTWRLADAQLAELLFDSASDALTGVRGATRNRRSFRFGAGDAVIRVHLTQASMIMMIEPPLSVECRVVTEESSEAHRTDELGELVLDAPELPLRIEIDLPGGTVVTPWITG
jgi:hypothetical protein